MSGSLRPDQGSRLPALAATVLTLLSLGLLVVWYDALVKLLAARPTAYALASYRIAAPDGSGGHHTVTVGREELLQPAAFDAAEGTHVQFEWNGAAWRVHNVAGVRRLTLWYAQSGHSRAYDSARWPIVSPATIEFGGTDGPISIGITPGDERLTLDIDLKGVRTAAESGRQRLNVSIGRLDAQLGLTEGDAPATTCGSGSGFLGRQIRKLNLSGRAWLGLEREVPIVLLGGNVTCSEAGEPARIALPGVPQETLAIYAVGGTLYLGPGPGGSRLGQRIARTTVVVAGGSVIPLGSLANAVNDSVRGTLTELTIGRTDYRLDYLPDGAIDLIPIANNPWRWGPVQIRQDLPGQTLQTLVPVNSLDLSTLLHIVEESARSWSRPAIVMGAGLSLGLLILVRQVFRGLSAPSHLTKQERREYRSQQLGEGPRRFLAVLLITLSASIAALLYGLGEQQLWALGYPTALLLVLLCWALATLSVAAACRAAWLGALFWLLVTSQVMLGNIVLAQLAFGGDSMRWVGFFTRSLAPLAILATLVLVGSLVSIERWQVWLSALANGPGILQLPIALRHGAGGAWLIRTLPLAVLALAILVWLAFGREEGVEGLLQPSELIKVGMVLLVAMAIVTAYKNSVIDVDSEHRLIGVAASFFLVLILLALFSYVPILRHDYSTVLIMLVTAAAMFGGGGLLGTLNRLWLLAEALRRSPRHESELIGLPETSRRRRGLVRLATRLSQSDWKVFVTSATRSFGRWIIAWMGILTMLTSLIGYALVIRELGRPDAIAWADEGRGGSYAGIYDRLLAYLDLRLDRPGLVLVDYPDEGRQVRLSRAAIVEAPCRVAMPAGSILEWLRRWLGHLLPQSCSPHLAANGPPLGEPNDPRLHQVPVVQNDFIGSFVIARLGAGVTALLMLLQHTTVALTASVAAQIYRWRPGFEADRSRRHLLALIALGSGVLLAMQWALSWCNVFGLLPVVGQPMTFIASAGSHVVLTAGPIVLVMLVAVRLDTVQYGELESTEPPEMPGRTWRLTEQWE